MHDRTLFDGHRSNFRQPLRWSAIFGGGLLTAAIVVIDLLLPLGIAGGIPYIAPVMLAMWLPDRRLIFAVAALCTGLVLLGLMLSPPGADMAIALPNRGLAIAALWTVALLTFQRRDFERALAASEAAKHAVLETTADGIAMLDADGHVLSANPAFLKIFGVGPEGLYRSPFASLLTEADAERFRSRVELFLTSRENVEPELHEFDGRRADGERFPVEVIFVPISGGGAGRYTATVRDITERRLLEKHLLRVSDQERRALGYSVHEEFGQALTGISLIGRHLAQRLEQRQAVEPREATELAELLQELDRQALDLYRTISPLDAAEHFHEAVREIVDTAAGRNGVRVSYQGSALHPPADIFRAAQLVELLRAIATSVVNRPDINFVDVSSWSSTTESGIEICIPGGASESTSWGEILRPFAYRAKVIDVRFDVEDRGEIACVRGSWVHEEEDTSHGESPLPRRFAGSIPVV